MTFFLSWKYTFSEFLLNMTLFEEFLRYPKMIGASWMLPIMVIFFAILPLVKPNLRRFEMSWWLICFGCLLIAIIRFVTNKPFPTALCLLMCVGLLGYLDKQGDRKKLVAKIIMFEILLVACSYLSYGDRVIFYFIAYNLGYVTVSSSNGWPWCLGEAVIAVPLLSIGNRFYLPLMKVLKKKTMYAVGIGVVCLLAFILMFVLQEPHTDMAHNIIPKEFYLMAILGSLCVIILSLEIDRFTIRGGQCLAYFGRTSLIIMCVHEPLKRIILMVLSKVVSMPTDVIRNEIGMSIVTMFIVVAVCIPLIEVINRKLSWIIGKF